MSALEKRLRAAERLAAVTQRIGFALWQLQELEGVAAQYFVMLAQSTKGMGVAAGEELVAKAQAKTFGQTINEMARAGLLDKDMEARIRRLLTERNWLVHRSRADSRSAIHGDAAMSKVVARIDGVSKEANVLLSEIGKLAEGFAVQSCLSRALIDETAAGLLERWHSGEGV